MDPTLPTTQIIESVDGIWGIPLQPVGCSHCKQVFLVPPAYTGKSCPVCERGNLAPQPALLRPEPPEMIVPFQKKISDLSQVLANFAGGVWLRPDDFNPETMLKRITTAYLPLWLVDSNLTGDWQAEAGFDYQVKSSQESYSDNGWRSRDVLETRVRWEPRLGQIDRYYNNVASNALTDHQQTSNLIGSYNLTKAVPYQATQLGNAFLRVPDLQPENAWPDAQTNLAHLAANDCQQACQAQHIRNFAIHASYSGLNWTQLLLPLFYTFYKDDDGIPHPVLINGQTGFIGGTRLASQKKGWRIAGISLGAAITLLLLGLICFALSMALPFLSILGVLLIVVAFGAGAFAIVPAVWPWQWNRKHQERKIVTK